MKPGDLYDLIMYAILVVAALLLILDVVSTLHP